MLGKRDLLVLPDLTGLSFVDLARLRESLEAREDAARAMAEGTFESSSKRITALGERG